MKKGSISIAILISLVVLLSGATLTKLALNEKYRANEAYKRIENRYIAESGVEMAVGLLLSYFDNQDYVLSYTNEGGSCSIADLYAPYLIYELQEYGNADELHLAIIERETNDYLSSIGFLDFSHGGGVEIILHTMNDKENFKLSRLCVSPGFTIGENGEIGNKQSIINPLFFTIKSKYKGGEVMCNIKISNLNAVRKPFSETPNNEISSVEAWLDITQVKVEYQNYQNYIVKGGAL